MKTFYFFFISNFFFFDSYCLHTQASIIDEPEMKLLESKEKQALIDAARQFCIGAKKKMQATENHNPIVENKIELLNTLIEDCSSKFNALNLDFNSKIELLMAILLNKK